MKESLAIVWLFHEKAVPLRAQNDVGGIAQLVRASDS